MRSAGLCGTADVVLALLQWILTRPRVDRWVREMEGMSAKKKEGSATEGKEGLNTR
jgi:hypothetical protein